MIIVSYYRKKADVYDVRCFTNISELNNWLVTMKELDDEYYITHIELTV